MTSPHTLARIAPLLGRDLRLDFAQHGGFFEDADLAATARASTRLDVALADGVDNLTQGIANRLKTRRGELAALGHPDYGSRHHELVGQPNVDRTRNLIKLYVLQALRDEPRIAKVLAIRVAPEHDPPRETVRIDITVRLIDTPVALDLVVPFSLGVGV